MTTSQSTSCGVESMDQKKAEVLFEDNQKLVYAILNKYYPTFAQDEDMQQEGMFGLWKACLTYDPSGYKFSTYAGTCILNQVRMAMRQQAKQPSTISLNTPILGEDKTVGELGDLIEDPVPSIDVGYISWKEYFSKLKPTEQQIVNLKLQGYTFKQISQQLGMKQTTIQMKLYRIWIKYQGRRNRGER